MNQKNYEKNMKIMHGAKSTYAKNQRPHGNTALGLEGKPTTRINKTGVRPSIEPRKNTARQHHLNNGGLEEKEGGAGAGRESLFWSLFSYLFTCFSLFIRAAHLCVFTFFHFFFTRVFSSFSAVFG